MTNSVTSLAARLERWLGETHDKPVRWNDPAHPEQIDALEQTLGASLPSALRHWMRVHDGQPWVAGNPPVLPAAMLFLSCEEIADEWRRLLEFADDFGDDFFGRYQDHDRVRQVVFHRGRIPLAYAEGTVYLMLDLIPGPNGHEGQIIYLYTECDFVVVGENFRHFLARYVDLLETGKLALVDVHNDGGGFITAPHDVYKEDRVWSVAPEAAP